MIKFNKSNINDDYIITSYKIGFGYSGNLYLCYDKKKYDKYVLKTLKICKESLNEIKTQLNLSSKYIINIVDLYKDKKYYYLILEYADGGDLFDKLRYINLSEYDLKIIIYNIALLIQFMHSKNIIHSDLKLENILIKNNELKLCDFGFSRHIKSKVKKCFYTIPYTSPEQLNNNYYNKKTDIWALGIICYYFYFDKFPFKFNLSYTKESNEIETALDLFNLPLEFDDEKKISNDFKNLISLMLVHDYNKRIDIKQVIYLLEQMI